MVGLPIYSSLLLCSSVKFCGFIYIFPVHFLLRLFWGVLYHSFLNQLQSDFYLLILILLLLKKKEGSSRNRWKDIEETHRIRSRELSFRERRQGWYQGWRDSWVETPRHLSGSLSLHGLSLISTYLCILTSPISIIQKKWGCFCPLVPDSKILGKWPRNIWNDAYSQKQKCKWKQHWNIISQLSY